jgi:hypothetical protein
MRFGIATLALAFIFSPDAHSAKNALCITPFSNKGGVYDSIDLTVKTPPVKTKTSKLEKIYIQKGKYIYDEKELSKKKGESYCIAEYTVYPSKPYSKIWGKNAIHSCRANVGPGEQMEPSLTLSPRPNSPWVAIRYDCPNITTHQQLKNELKPLIDAPCDDWGDYLPGAKKNPSCPK